MSSSKQERESYSKLIALWETKEKPHLIELLDATVASLHQLSYKRQKKFIVWWIHRTVGNPLPGGFVEEMLVFARKIYKHRDRHELKDRLRSARHETIEYAIRFEQNDFGERHLDMEGRFLAHLCEMIREDNTHQA